MIVIDELELALLAMLWVFFANGRRLKKCNRLLSAKL